MAVPFSFSNVQFPNQNYYCGPWKAANGSIYVLLLDSSDQSIEIHKCEDYDFPVTTAFSEQDAAGAPTKVVTSGESAWGYISGNNIHVVSWFDDATNSWYYYHRFNTATDSWDAIDQVIDTWDDKFKPTSPACSFVFREDDGGQEAYVCLYNGPDEKIGGTYYNRVSYAVDADGAGTWTTNGVAVDAGGETQYSGCVAVRGSAPDANGHVVHFFFGPLSSGGTARTLRYSAGWSLSAAVTIPAGSIYYHKFGPGSYYDDSGTDRIVLPYRENVTSDPYVWMITEDSSGDLSGTGDASNSVYTLNVQIYNSNPVLCLALDKVSGRVHLMWAEETDDDLWRDYSDSPWSSWANEIEEEAGTCERISCNVYARNGSLKLAFVWEDNGTIKYDEYDIGQETAPALTAANLPQQNYKIGPEKV
jgi:hypothetical protein